MSNQILQVPPKYYANFNKNQPKDYWDYDNFENEWGVGFGIIQYRTTTNTRSSEKSGVANTRTSMRGCAFLTARAWSSKCSSQ